MGLFERKQCARCGKDLGLIFGKTKIADGQICKDCNSLLSPLLANKSLLTLNDIEEHLKYREENKKVLSTFKASKVIGNKEKVYFDENQKKFVISSSNDYISKNIDVFSLEQVSACELSINVDEEEIFNKDEQGNDVSFDPPRYTKNYEYKVEMTLNHPWVGSITIDVSDVSINEDEKNELLRIDNIANELVAEFKGEKFIPKTSLENKDENNWVCSKCGTQNDINTKFCTNCGQSKEIGNKYCGECGTKLAIGTKFCPNCGKAVQ